MSSRHELHEGPCFAATAVAQELARTKRNLDRLLSRFIERKNPEGVEPSEYLTHLRLYDEHIRTILATFEDGGELAKRFRPPPVPQWIGVAKTFKSFQAEFIRGCDTRISAINLLANALLTNEMLAKARRNQMLDEFYPERLTLQKKTGERFEGIQASLDAEKGEICLVGERWQVDEGDTIIRLLPNGRTECYTVESSTFEQKFHVFPAHYKLQVNPEGRGQLQVNPEGRGQQMAVVSGGVTVNYYGGGNLARVNIGSTDASHNIASFGSASELFAQIRKAVDDEVPEQEDRDKIIGVVDDLEKSQGTGAFLERYKEFMAVAADHLTLLSPFLPALAALL